MCVGCSVPREHSSPRPKCHSHNLRSIKFEWDHPNAAASHKKHQISFNEARSSALSPLARQPSAKARSIKVADVKAEYDLSTLKARKNPYASKLKKPVTMGLSEDVVEYFKSMADSSLKRSANAPPPPSAAPPVKLLTARLFRTQLRISDLTRSFDQQHDTLTG